MEKIKFIIWLQFVVLITVLCWGCAGKEEIVFDDPTLSGQTVDANKNADDNSPQMKDEKDGKESAAACSEEPPAGTIVIYVCGAVNAPGVYELSVGSRAADAVEAAGGMREDAQSDVWNLAQEVVDGQQIRIPYIGEEASAENMNQGAEGSETGNADASGAGGRININTADAKELMTIPGIGQAKADSIINYRQERGAFSSVEEIMQIEGIKEGVFEKIKEYICVK